MNNKILFIIAICEFCILLPLSWLVIMNSGKSAIKDENSITASNDIAEQIALQTQRLLNQSIMEFTFVGSEKAGNMRSSQISDGFTTPTYNKQIIFWEEISSDAYSHEFEKNQDTIVPKTDFEKNSIIVSFGRKIIKLRYSPDDFYNSSSILAIVTFSNEFYDNTMFYYTVERRNDKAAFVFVSPLLSSPCFIIEMKEEEQFLSGTLLSIHK